MIINNYDYKMVIKAKNERGKTVDFSVFPCDSKKRFLNLNISNSYKKCKLELDKLKIEYKVVFRKTKNKGLRSIA